MVLVVEQKYGILQGQHKGQQRRVAVQEEGQFSLPGWHIRLTGPCESFPGLTPPVVGAPTEPDQQQTVVEKGCS